MIQLLRFFTPLILILLCGSIWAQSTISGKISDGISGEDIIGATIMIAGTTQGTISDYEGNFELDANAATDTLEISFIGYENLIIPIDGRSEIDVLMNINNNQLDEIVVVGYGMQKRKTVTGAVARIDSDEISKTPTLRVEQALQGRTPGVQVTSLSGQPGEEPTVRVRGVGTTGNAKPLYIVDGIAVGGIDYLNPGDIETIDVLKDAASAAIYGARAANGVILITTKKGQAGGRFTMTYDAYYGSQNTTNRLEMLNSEQYISLMNEGARNAGLTEPFDPQEIPANNTDWQEALFTDNAPMQSHQLGFSGGSEKSSFASSMAYFTQQGIIGGPKSQFDRITARINSTHKISNLFGVGNNLAYTHLVRRNVAANTSFTGPFNGALNLDPLTPVYEEDENKLSEYPYSVEPVVRDATGRVYGISENIGAEIVNPLALIENLNGETRKDQIVGNFYLDVTPIENLKFRSNMGVDFAYLLDDSFKDFFFLNGAQLNDNKTSVDKHIQRFFTWQWENTLSYTKEFNRHTVGGLIGTTATEFNYENLQGFNAGVPVGDPDNVYLNLATDTVWRASGGAAHSALYSQFGRLNYSFDDKYSVTAIMRRDGSSKFGANQRFGIFPSLGVAWVVSEEAFLQNTSKLNYLKLRASWGINGNQDIGDYQFVSVIDKTRGYDLGGGTQTGSSPLFIENADIRWEESEQYNLGVDMGFFDNKVQANVDFYIKNTNGLLEKIAIPGHVGNEGPISNVGSVRNRGVELNLNWRKAAAKTKYYVGINGAYNQNEMTFIGNSEKVITGASWAVSGPVTRAEEGQPIAFFWGYETDGIFQNETEVFSHINAAGDPLQPNANPGDVRFVDVNGDGVINDSDRTKIGDPNPDFTFGFNGSISRGPIDVSFFLQGNFGNQLFNGTQRQDLRFTNRTTKILDRWTGEGTSNSIPRYTWLDTNNNYRVSDLYIEDGDFVRVKNIQIGYTLPSKLLDKLQMQNWRFYLSAENIYTFTGYTGGDPEIGASTFVDSNGRTQGAFNVGIDRAIYPQAQIFRFGTNVTF